MAQLRPFLLGAALALATATPALADAIDGDWCFGDGRSFSIHGPEIVTPGGTKTNGNYTRHAFSYVVPGGRDPDPGATVDMTLMNENLVQLRVIAKGATTPGAAQAWKRCSPKVS